MTTSSIPVTIAAAVEITLIGFAIYYLTGVVGTNDNNNELTKTLTPVVFILAAIVLVHTVMWYMYFTYNPLAMNYYIIVSGAMTMIFSLTALSVSLINA
jgi:hypothetical protein